MKSITHDAELQPGATREAAAETSARLVEETTVAVQEFRFVSGTPGGWGDLSTPSGGTES